MACHAETQPLVLQMNLPKVDFAYARKILSMQTADLCYKHPLKNGIFTAYELLSTTFIANTFAKIEDKKLSQKISSKNITAGV